MSNLQIQGNKNDRNAQLHLKIFHSDSLLKQFKILSP